MVGNKLESLVPDGGRKKCSPVTHKCWNGPESMICSSHSLRPKVVSVVATWKAGTTRTWAKAYNLRRLSDDNCCHSFRDFAVFSAAEVNSDCSSNTSSTCTASSASFREPIMKKRGYTYGFQVPVFTCIH